MSWNTFRDPDAEYRTDDKRSSSETFIIFGTAFPEQTEKDRNRGMSDSGQFVPVWKQEARDEKGRRRFHGAFTGGFSAGYFNTVGSKEGWQPSNFISSRASRSEKREMRPEDYMDEEDLQELAGSKKLVATEEFDILGGTERELAARQKQKEEEERGGALGFLGSSLMNLVGPTKESVGIRLLSKMGWKPGQGIGPRLTQKQKQALSMDDEEEDIEDDRMANITFAPRDTPIVDFSAKTNTYGLGYDLEKLVHQVAEMRRLREMKREEEDTKVSSTKRAAFGVPQNSTKHAGFGLGTFEDDDDDYEVYGETTISREYHHTLYDDEEDNYAQNRSKRKKVETLDRASGGGTLQSRCTDGRLAPRGYIVSKQSQELGKWYQPPKVPAEFDGRHIATDSKGVPIETPQHGLNADQRGMILGEKPIEQRSVFDFIPAKSKDKLDNILKFVTDETLKVDKSKLSNFPTVSKEVANLALRGFMPFGDNPKKQERYRYYLENMAGILSEDGKPKDNLPIPEGLTYEQGMKEMDEFAQAARIFRPISAMMSGRFTSARTTVIEQTTSEGGLKTEKEWRKEKDIQDKEREPKQVAKEQSQEAAAASMNMFGQLTRTIKPFYPCKLLCKRFNVRNPHPNHDPSTVSAAGRTQAGSRQALSEETMDTMLRTRKDPTPLTALPTTTLDDPLLNAVIPKPSQRAAEEPVSAPSVPSTPVVSEETKAQEEKQREEEEAKPMDYERPSMDIFKAIFENSDDEEGEEEEALEPTSTELVPTEINDDEETEDMFIGPPPPPAPVVQEPEIEPFRPMFAKPSERIVANHSTPEKATLPVPLVKSEEVIVSHFKPRERAKRRRVSVSDEDSDTQEKEDRHSKKRHKEPKSRKRSRSRERSHKKKKSKKERKDKKEKSRRPQSALSYDDKDEDLLLLNEAEWVEKEPQVEVVAHSQERTPPSRPEENVPIRRRMRASDLW
ncbi:hypothetical protein EC973_005154 [Apophysomyces ossiformis]|uniref:G-patch domain-containing protein n=1 Tax=Apophysomyces ossiformis TaxID=679940 RepID=A0A8H7BHH4_9FUNG|nr:hypothetical protein EC973_005154 [Apophysomyces ossiformis]